MAVRICNYQGQCHTCSNLTTEDIKRAIDEDPNGSTCCDATDMVGYHT